MTKVTQDKKMMQKISTKTNVINWFDIPVADTARAKKFYETIFDIEMKTQYVDEIKAEMTFFTSTPGVIEATSGRVSGALIKSGNNTPSSEGVIIYLNANPSIQKVIDKIGPAGGKVIVPKTKMIAGYVSIFIDTEGNTIGLHSEK